MTEPRGSPRSGRLIITVLAASAANDFMQAAFKVLCAKASEVGDQPGVRTTDEGSTSSRSPLYAG